MILLFMSIRLRVFQNLSNEFGGQMSTDCEQSDEAESDGTVSHKKYWPPSNVEYSTFEAPLFGSDFFDLIGLIVECRIFDIRSTLLRMSNFRHSISRPLNVEYSTSKTPFFGCRTFDIRSTLLRIGFFRFDRPSVECRIFDIRSASVECRIIDIRSTPDRMTDL